MITQGESNPNEKVAIIPGEDVAHRYGLEQTKMALDAGWLGRAFGSPSNAPTNITGFVLCLFAIACVYLILFRAAEPVSELLKIMLPVITLALGYLFGRKS